MLASAALIGLTEAEELAQVALRGVVWHRAVQTGAQGYEKTFSSVFTKCMAWGISKS